MKRLATWILPIMWMAVVLAMSSSEMSAENTGSVLHAVLTRLVPWLRPAHVDLINGLARKTAHLTEYAILAALWRRAFVRGEVMRPALGGAFAWTVCVACAIVDETHQAMLPSRTGAVKDVVLDSLGAAVAVLLAQLGWWRAVDTLTVVLLWTAAVGGIGALALDLAAGASGGTLWLTVPAAAGLLFYRWRRSTLRS